MKSALIQIGGRRFLCPSVKVATQLVDLFSKVVPVDWGHHDGKTVFKVADAEDSRELTIELQLVDESQIVLPLKRVPKTRRLGPGMPTMPPLDPGF